MASPPFILVFVCSIRTISSFPTFSGNISDVLLETSSSQFSVFFLRCRLWSWPLHTYAVKNRFWRVKEFFLHETQHRSLFLYLVPYRLRCRGWTSLGGSLPTSSSEFSGYNKLNLTQSSVHLSRTLFLSDSLLAELLFQFRVTYSRP